MPDKHQNLDWNRWWEKFVGFFEQVIGATSFWTEEVDETRHDPNREWIAAAIAEIIKAGTQNDERAFSIALMPRTLRLLEVILQNAASADQASGTIGTSLTRSVRTSPSPSVAGDWMANDPPETELKVTEWPSGVQIGSAALPVSVNRCDMPEV